MKHRRDRIQQTKADLMEPILRAFCGYYFLILVLRIVGRRPGKQLTPFEFVLIFFVGGLALTGIVGNDGSLTNAICQIVTVAFAHQLLTWARFRWKAVARVVDGTPLYLIADQDWRQMTLYKMRIQRDDIASSARDKGVGSLKCVGAALLERNGEISILPEPQPDEQGPS